MKNEVKILLFIVLLFASRIKVYSQSSAINTSGAQQFTSTILDLNGFAFNDRAIEKVYDFYNYLNILSMPGYNEKLKEVAKTDAVNLFCSADCKVDGVKVAALLDSCMGLKQTMYISVSDVKVKRELSNDTKYSMGTLSANVSIGGKPAAVKEITIVVYLTVKQFGSRTEDVWTVFLCDIK